MIGIISGKLLTKSPEYIVVEAGGVGYEVSVPISVLSELPDVGSDVVIYTHMNVRDDAIDLYGFLDAQVKRVFRMLLGVTGVGPRLALNILSGDSVEDFLRAIETEDTGFLTRLPGVGKKTAQRMIFELKEKLPSSGVERDRVYDDTLSALVNLGYKKTTAAQVLERLYRNGMRDIEELLRESLKYLNK